MLILLHLDPSDSAGLKAYRLHVKERLYRFNFVCVIPLCVCCFPILNTLGTPFSRKFLPSWRRRKDTINLKKLFKVSAKIITEFLP